MNEEDQPTRKVMAEMLRYIAESDYPSNWGNLLPTLVDHIQDVENILHIHNGMLGLRKLVKRYESKPSDTRPPLYDIIEQTFPLLSSALESLLPHNSMEACLIMKLILKTFWSATCHFLPSSDVLPFNRFLMLHVNCLFHIR